MSESNVLKKCVMCWRNVFRIILIYDSIFNGLSFYPSMSSMLFPDMLDISYKCDFAAACLVLRKMSQYVYESQIIVLSDRYMITWCVLQQRPVMTDHLANKIRISNRLILDLNMLFCWVIYLVRKQSENRVRIDREQTWDKRETKREHREKQRGEQRLKWRTLRENETERRRGLQSGWKKEKETGRNELNSQQVTKFAF